MATLQNSNSSEKGHASHEEFHQEGEVHVGSHEEISWHLVGAIVWAMLLAYSSEWICCGDDRVLPWAAEFLHIL